MQQGRPYNFLSVHRPTLSGHVSLLRRGWRRGHYIPRLAILCNGIIHHRRFLIGSHIATRSQLDRIILHRGFLLNCRGE
jgi:hypothetical protein